MRMALFIIIFLGVFALITIYINRRLVDKLDMEERTKSLLRLFLVVNFFGIIGYMSARYLGDTPGWLYFLLSLPIGVLFLLFCTALLYDISRMMVKVTPVSDGRRAFFKKGLDIGALGLALGVSAKATHEASVVELERVEVKIDALAREYTLVQLSDLHIGGLINASFIESIVKRVNVLAPDLVVITGDLVDIKLSSARKSLAELGQLRSRYGTYFVVGNHEYFHGIEEIMDAVKALGIKVLENEHIFIGEEGEGFNLAGVYDMFGYRAKHHEPDIYRALERANQDLPTILLAHQPLFIEEADGKVDLMLSGHTHGGQLFPFQALVKLQQPYIEGLHRHSETTQVYVNKGTGFWGPPMRLGASSEITHITLKGAV